MKNKYYVYEHLLDGKVFYIGSGNENTKRAYQLTYSRRNNLWNNFVKNRKNEIEIRIVKYFDTSLEAERYEQQLTNHYHKLGLAQCNIAQGKAKFGDINGMFKNTYSHSEETKKKMSESKLGDKNPMFGKIPHNKGKELSENQKDKIKKSLSKKIKCITDGKIFDSKKDAEFFYNHRIPSSAIYNNNLCKGKYFIYVSKEEEK